VARKLRIASLCVARRSATKSRSATEALTLARTPRDDIMEEERISMQDDFDTNRDREMDRDDDTRGDLGDEGRSHQAKGSMRNAAGKLQEGLGKLTGKHDLEREGKTKQVQGNAENLVGRVQEGTDDRIDDLGEQRDDLLSDH
jgi:uncharacterized protein YjbJ (UPF0337 family)